jgi:hypothetical protein
MLETVVGSRKKVLSKTVLGVYCTQEKEGHKIHLLICKVPLIRAAASRGTTQSTSTRHPGEYSFQVLAK